MKIAVLGATGRVGSRLTKELVSRGHKVTAISRHPEKLEPHKDVTPVVADVQNEAALAKTIAGHDALVHSVMFRMSDPAKVIAAAKKAGVSRLLVVGGAGSLEAAPGVKLIDTPTFPPEYKPEASAGVAFLQTLKGEKELSWTFLSPSAMFAPGERTGKFRTGGNQLLVAADGKSNISMEDYVIAMADEIEKPQHVRERYTVGY